MASSGNFGTIGGLEKQTNFTFSQGNLKYSTTTNNNGFITSTAIPETGKYYYEMYILSVGGTQDQVYVGVCNPNTMRSNLTGSRGGAEVSGAGGYTFDNYFGAAYLDGSKQSNDGIGNYRSFPQKIGILVNRDDNEIKWTLNGSDLSSAYTIPASGPLYAYVGSGGGSNTAAGVFNFGQDSTFGGAVSAGGNSDSNDFGDFTFSVPSNYVALTSPNIPISSDIDPAETDDDIPTKQFGVVTYTGNGSTQSITGLGFQPDLVWLKRRDGSKSHALFDSSRGVTKYISADNANNEATDTSTLTAFGSDGFSLASPAANNLVNGNGFTYVGWAWKVNAGTTASNSNGDISSTVQVNDKAGFSIVKYTGDLSSSGNRTVGHGLSTAPDLIIRRGLNVGERWAVSHVGCTSFNYMMELNSTNAEIDKSGNGSMSAPTTTVFSNNHTDGYAVNGTNYVAYCFHSVDGYSRFSSYVGNGDADGPFVYTGFRPRFLIIKAADSGQTWFMYDTARSTFNPVNRYLYGQRDLAEDTAGSIDIDFLSNGFKIRNSRSDTNTSGDTYVYMCWGSVPFKYNNTF